MNARELVVTVTGQRLTREGHNMLAILVRVLPCGNELTHSYVPSLLKQFDLDFLAVAGEWVDRPADAGFDVVPDCLNGEQFMRVPATKARSSRES